MRANIEFVFVSVCNFHSVQDNFLLNKIVSVFPSLLGMLCILMLRILAVASLQMTNSPGGDET